jgi:hypothetical protein
MNVIEGCSAARAGEIELTAMKVKRARRVIMIPIFQRS